MIPKENTTLMNIWGASWYNRLTEWRAWYSGDQDILRKYYSTEAQDNTRFWSRLGTGNKKHGVHIPLAGDIAATSSNLLFAETPEISYKEQNETTAIDRVQYFANENGLHNRLLEAAEICSAMGGVVLKLDIDTDLSPVPILSTVSPLQFIPTFRRGRLWEATTFRVVASDDNGKVWRLFEERKRSGTGIIIDYKLFEGQSSEIGRVVSLDSIDETASLNLKPLVYENVGLGIMYVPNMLPNRLDIHSPQGVSDYSGVVPMFDSLDEIWTSLMREIRLAKSTIFVDDELLKDGEVDIDTEAYVKLKITDLRIGKEGYKPIEHVQPEIRVESYLKAATEMTADILSRCGYSPQSFGFRVEGRAETGTALRIRERKSLMTRQKKSRYWQDALQWLFWDMQRLENSSSIVASYNPVETIIVLQDSITPEPSEEAQTIRDLRQAEVISIEMGVRRLNPDWTDEQVEQEVEQIAKEKGSMVTDIFNERV